PGLLGDVVICPQVAAVQARQSGHTTADEIDLLCAHGILHLLGYDHADAAEHAKMFGLQDRLLTAWRSERADGPEANDAAAGQGASSQGASGQGAADANGAVDGAKKEPG